MIFLGIALCWDSSIGRMRGQLNETVASENERE